MQSGWPPITAVADELRSICGLWEYENDTVGGFPYSERFIIVEGGPDQPFIAANIYLLDKAIEPVFD